MEQYFPTILQTAELIGILFLVYKFFRDPDIKTEKNLSTMKTACTLKHERIDSDISTIKESITLIKENHLRHIEDRLGKVDGTLIRIETILSERSKT